MLASGPKYGEDLEFHAIAAIALFKPVETEEVT